MGVAMPPTEAANAVTRMRPQASGERRQSLLGSEPGEERVVSSRRMEMAMGSIIAAVAVFETQAETKEVRKPNPAKSPNGLRPTQGRPRTARAMRRLRPCLTMASASRKPPRNRKMTGSAKGRRASRAGVIPMTTHKVGPSSEVAARGRASLSHQVPTSAMTASIRCAGSGREGMGRNQTVAKKIGPAAKPSFRRQRSNRSSAGESRAAGDGDSADAFTPVRGQSEASSLPDAGD
jgi:hypothetical protein